MSANALSEGRGTIQAAFRLRVLSLQCLFCSKIRGEERTVSKVSMTCYLPVLSVFLRVLPHEVSSKIETSHNLCRIINTGEEFGGGGAKGTVRWDCGIYLEEEPFKLGLA